MNLNHQHIVSKILLFVLTFQFINLSVDFKNDNKNSLIVEEIELNMQNSLVELVLEKWLEIEDVFKKHGEHDEQDEDCGTTNKNKVSIYIADCQIVTAVLVKDYLSKEVSTLYLFSDQKFVSDIDIPPPQTY